MAVRDYNAMHHLKWILEQTDTHDQDVVVMTARLTSFSAGGYDLAMEQIFSDYEQTLFTRAVVSRKRWESIFLCWWSPPAIRRRRP